MSTTRQETLQETENDRWDLAVLYRSDEAWASAKQSFEGRLTAIPSLRGSLGSSPRSLLEALTLIYDLRRDYGRLASYAHMRSDLDRRNAADLARAQESDRLGTRIDAETSFLPPEILALPAGTIGRFLAEEPRLAPYAHDLDDILSKAPHTLSPSEETLLAESGAMAQTPENVYGVLSAADVQWPEITLSTGEKATLDPASYAKYRTLENREDRLAVFRSFFGAWQSFARTFGVTLDGEVRKTIFYARARRYASALEAALDRNHIPVTVYDAIVAAAHEGLPSLHRYLRLRSRMLGVEDLGYHDIYAPLVPHSSQTYTIGAAKRLVLDSLAPLGAEYVAALSRGYEERWIDVWPAKGKRSGAYSNGAVYGEHPFILMNFTGNFDGVSTLAHESGHAMHSWLANGSQPFPTADYSIFVAEVASTFNEALLSRWAIDHAADDDERLALLSARLDGLRGTFYRQAMFAEFEKEIYEAAERGETLTGERLGDLYLALLRRYHAADEGVCAIEELYRVEWAYIPHFYSTFYVFQYSTGYAASMALASRVLAAEPGATERFLEFLRAGGSDYPYDLLRRAGIDLATPEPYRLTVAEMDRTMDEMEAILARRADPRVIHSRTNQTGPSAGGPGAPSPGRPI